jgi:uncharacterized protein
MPDRTDTPAGVFLRVVTGVAANDLDGLPDLYAENTYVTHPLDPDGAPPLRSRAEIAAHFGLLGEAATRRPRPAREVQDVVVHQTTDPEVIVAEFAYVTPHPATGEPLRMPCVFVMRVRDGLIVESHDYGDHVRRAVAGNRTDQLIASIHTLATGAPASPAH